MTRGLSSQLRALATTIRKEVESDMLAVADVIKVEAQISITRGSVSGKFHVPSKPGEAPNNDVGVLADGIISRQTSPLTVEIASTAPYASYLEYGSSRMSPRPYMVPAAVMTAKDVARAISISARRGVRKHFRF